MSAPSTTDQPATSAVPAPTRSPSPSPPPPTLTKRRLESAISALDQATNHRPTSLARPSSSSSLSSNSKRRRVSTPTSLPALEALLPPTALPPAPPPPPPPSYTPLSLDTLLSRLATFKLSTFSPLKPPAIGPLPCALHGWQSAPTPQKPKDRVQCVTCGAGLVLALPGGGWSTPLGQRLAVEMERQVAGAGHNASCPWRTRPCARGLYALPAGLGRNALVEEMRDEVVRLEKEGVGRMVLKLPDGVGEEERRKVSEAVKDEGEVAFAAEDRAAAEANPATDFTVAPLLALFGWQAPSPQLLACKYCTRQVPLSAYLPKPTASSSDPPPPPTAFDVVAQHQAFCPYVSSPAPLAATNGKLTTPTNLSAVTPRAGWQVRLDTLLRRERQGTRGGQGVAVMLGATAGGTPNGKQGTRELLSYVRGLLGPKAAAATAARRISTGVSPLSFTKPATSNA